MITELKEITDWDVPNHTYYLNEAGKCIAFKRENTDVVKYFKNPIMFSRKLRKFKSKKIERI